MIRICSFLFFTITLCSCEKEYSQTKRLNIIIGRIIDSPKTTNFSDYKLTARSIFGTNEKDIASTQLSEDGTFRMEYYSEGNYTGKNLRIAFIPSMPKQSKFEFLPYGESWNRNFYIGDSATVFIKLNNDILNTDTINLITNSGKFKISGPSTNKKLGTIRLTNYFDNLYYHLNKNEGSYIDIIPSGDPIVDTITLTINP